MRKLQHVLSLFLALWIAASSMGVNVSSHTCKESGFSEIKIGNLKACCKHEDAEGISAEPCCTLNVQKLKLPTLRLQDPNFQAPNWSAVLSLVKMPFLGEASLSDPLAAEFESNAPPLPDGRSHLIQFCQYRI